MNDALEILQHALGVDEFGRGKQYRCHFVAGPGSEDHDVCVRLVDAGFMTRRPGDTLPFAGDDLFHVTDAGRAFVARHSPSPPTLSAGQRRYQVWLDGPADWLSFGDWLRTGGEARAS